MRSLSLALAASLWLATSLGAQQLRIYFIDVDQADAGAETIELIDPSEEVVDRFSYNGPERGVVIQTGH